MLRINFSEVCNCVCITRVCLFYVDTELGLFERVLFFFTKVYKTFRFFYPIVCIFTFQGLNKVYNKSIKVCRSGIHNLYHKNYRINHQVIYLFIYFLSW